MHCHEIYWFLFQLDQSAQIGHDFIPAQTIAASRSGRQNKRSFPFASFVWRGFEAQESQLWASNHTNSHQPNSTGLPKNIKNGIDKFDKPLDFGANLGNSQCVCSVLDTLGFTLFQCPRRTQRWRLCWRGRRDWPWKEGRPRWFVWHSSRCRVTGDPNWLRGVSHRKTKSIKKLSSLTSLKKLDSDNWSQPFQNLWFYDSETFCSMNWM